MFDAKGSGRSVSVSIDAKRHPVLMTSFAGIQINTRGETEFAMVFFSPSGHVWRGTRSYITTGTPARTSEDRRGGLLPPDSAMAQRLAADVVKRCAPPK